MPVLATMATIALLRGGGNSPGPFFDPEKLREMLADGLEDDDQLQNSLTIIEGLEAQLERYRASVDKSTDAYIEALSNMEGDEADLITQLGPLDRERKNVLKSVINYRRRLISELDDSTWAAVFD